MYTIVTLYSTGAVKSGGLLKAGERNFNSAPKCTTPFILMDVKRLSITDERNY